MSHYIETLNEQDLGAKRESTTSKNWVMYCPYCQHHKPRLAIHEDTGVWKCWVCDESGPFSKLAKKLGFSSAIEKDDVDSIDYITLPPNSRLLEYTMKRGIGQALTELALRYDQDLRACVFLYPHPITGDNCGYKIKYLKGKGFRWISVKGEEHPGIYIPDHDMFIDEEKYVVVTEGEFDALSLVELGINAIATGGATNAKSFPYLDRYETVYLCYDNDEAGRRGAVKAGEYFGDKAKTVLLPEAKDPNDWHVKHGGTTERFWEVVHSNPLVISAKALVSDTFSYLYNPDLVKGEPTGLVGLDKMLGGGKRLGELTITHAEAKTGKNSLWHQLMYYWLQRGIPLGYASRELSPTTEVMPNLFSIHLEKNLLDGVPSDEDEGKCKDKVKDWPLFFATGYGYMSLSKVKEWVIWLKEEHGVQYFFFDHLHYMLEEPEDHKSAGKLIMLLKTLAKDYNIHMDVIIQPNKVYEGMKLNKNTIKGTSALGQTLDNLLVFERVIDEKTGKRSNISRLSLEEGRSKLAKHGTVLLEYEPHTMRFYEVVETKTPLLDEIVPTPEKNIPCSLAILPTITTNLEKEK